MIRTILATLAGVFVAMLSVFAIELVGHGVFPVPAAMGSDDPPRISAIMETIPLGSKLFVLLAWFVAPLAGGRAAFGLGGWRWSHWLIAGLITLGAIANFAMIPHPPWMIAGGLVIPSLAALIVECVIRRRLPA